MPMMGPLFALFPEPVSLSYQEGTFVPSDFLWLLILPKHT
jgi:hypothetical protein